MKKIIALVLACIMLLSMVPMAGAAKFTDVRTADWFFPYVRDLTADGTIAGQTATTFNPNGSLTYGAALKLLSVGVTGKDAGNAASGHWAMNYLNEAVATGWTDIDAAKLDTPVTREAFCQIAAKAKNYTEQPASNPFKDTTDTGVLAMVQVGVISGMSEDTFAPNGILTRAQIAKIIWCMKNPGKTPTAPTKEEIAADVVEVTAVKILEKLSMDAGTSQKFTITIEPSNATQNIKWTSENPAIASVDQNGVITAHKGGQCHVIVTAESGVKATCFVTVNEIQGVDILDTLTMYPGNTQRFTVDLVPSTASRKSITWVAGNPAVATVSSDGVVTTHKPGQCHITAIAPNGLKDTCLLTVKAVVTPPSVEMLQGKIKATLIAPNLNGLNHYATIKIENSTGCTFAATNFEIGDKNFSGEGSGGVIPAKGNANIVRHRAPEGDYAHAKEGEPVPNYRYNRTLLHEYYPAGKYCCMEDTYIDSSSKAELTLRFDCGGGVSKVYYIQCDIYGKTTIRTPW